MAVKKKDNKSFNHPSTVNEVEKELKNHSESYLVEENLELLQEETMDETEEAELFEEPIVDCEESDLFEEETLDENEESELFEEAVDESEELDWFEEELEDQSEKSESSIDTCEVRDDEENKVLELAIRNTQSKINFDNVILANSKQHSRSFVNPGVITVIDGGKCGRRVAISKDLYVELELVDMVQIAFEDESILMGKFINENANSYGFRTQGAKHIIYCASLVREITQRLDLEFARENKTSITFNSVEYDYTFDTPIAMIKRY